MTTGDDTEKIIAIDSMIDGPVQVDRNKKVAWISPAEEQERQRARFSSKPS